MKKAPVSEYRRGMIPAHEYKPVAELICNVLQVSGSILCFTCSCVPLKNDIVSPSPLQEVAYLQP